MHTKRSKLFFPLNQKPWITHGSSRTSSINPDNNTTVHLTPGFYGIPERYHTLTVTDLFPRGIFISKENIEQKIESRMVPMSYNNLKNHVKSKIGQHKKYQAIPLKCIQRKGTHPTIRSLMIKNKTGSGIYRKILSRGGGNQIETSLELGEKNLVTSKGYTQAY